MCFWVPSVSEWVFGICVQIDTKMKSYITEIVAADQRRRPSNTHWKTYWSNESKSIKWMREKKKKTLLPLMEGNIAYIHIWAVCFSIFLSFLPAFGVFELEIQNMRTIFSLLHSFVSVLRRAMACIDRAHTHTHCLCTARSPWKLVFQSSLTRFQVASETEHGRKKSDRERENCA